MFAIIFRRTGSGMSHEIEPIGYETDRFGMSAGSRTRVAIGATDRAESLPCEQLAGPNGGCGNSRGTAVAIRPSVARQVAAQFMERGSAATSHRPRRCTSGRNQMSQLVAFVKSFARNEEGQDLLEYALLVALIALIAIGAVGAAGGAVNGIFGAIAAALGGAA